MFAAAVMAVSASAQTTQESKFLDNWYLGVNVGAATKTTHNAWFKNVNPSVGVRLGKWFTPVWGAAVEADLYARNRNLPFTHKTLVRGASGKFIGTINATNLFLGYKGEPRKFEIIPLAGIGGYHSSTFIMATSMPSQLTQVLTSHSTLAQTRLGRYM